MSKNKVLQGWLELREVAPADLKSKFQIGPEHIATDRSYEGLSPIKQWHNAKAHPAYFIFHGEKLALIYIDDESAMKKLDPGELLQEFGEADANLRSRAGKRVRFYVYADKGLAFAADKKAVHYVEIFPPTTVEDYQKRIYVEPPPFRK